MSRKPMERNTEHFLGTFFDPKSVAIIGAASPEPSGSEKQLLVGNATKKLLENLRHLRHL